jgi:hypothetical protein
MDRANEAWSLKFQRRQLFAAFPMPRLIFPLLYVSKRINFHPIPPIEARQASARGKIRLENNKSVSHEAKILKLIVAFIKLLIANRRRDLQL